MKAHESAVKCKAVCDHDAEGKIIYSGKAINFYLVDPSTSEVIEDDHPLKGKRIAGRAIVIPSGKGSSVVQLDGLYQLLSSNNQPSMIVVKDPDPVIVSAALICGVPLISGLPDGFLDGAKDGDIIKLKCSTKEVTVVH
ncbi:MAG: DUF126 domain-containing protein [Candidatus Thermoplasmatota archaeon]|jgi:predicted aconitase with swiveling domain|nr:DUF126 domain-containing protein [Candidatus Thermoplasmatota archaeon]MCL5789008.1 DUF126 domain-containing protein [Candidatus Thermoplasmatota archaeon]